MQFRIGNVDLNQKVVNEKIVRELGQSAQSVGGKEAEPVSDLVDQWLESGQIEKKDFQVINKFSRVAAKKYYSLNRRYWDKIKKEGKSYDDPEVKRIASEMSEAAGFLEDYVKIRDQLRVDTAKAAVAAAAGASFSGPVGLIAAYQAWSQASQWDSAAEESTRKLLDTFQGYLAGDSRIVTDGNEVEQVHRDKLWAAIGDILVLDDAVRKAESGNPVEIDLQYYELTSPEVVGKAARAALAGNSLRVNVDPGRLSYPDTDDEGNTYYAVDDIPDKLRSVIQLASLREKGADVAVTLFPVNRLLKDPENLMHRKVVRVGDTVLISGMNANKGSGENVDAGFMITGPAAARIAANFGRDMKNAAGAGPEDIWGQKHIELFRKADIRVSARGVAAILDVLGGPSEPGARLPKFSSVADLEALGTRAGVDVHKLLSVKGEDFQQVVDALNQGKEIPLSDYGKEKLLEVIKRAIQVTTDKENVAKAEELTPVSNEKVGNIRVDIADLPEERQAVILNAIAEAERYIYLPGFVLTRAVAAALVARKQEQAAKGIDMDIKVVLDPGVYPDGNTPNYWGVAYLEKNGIEPRWALLTRTGDHDRKIHAKQIITDKGQVVGSTNFSNKGMQDNWEESVYVHYNPDDKTSRENHRRAVAQFDDLWNNSSLDFSCHDLAAYWKRFVPDKGREWVIENTERKAVGYIIRKIEEYEEQSAQWIENVSKRADVKSRIESYEKTGMAHGYAVLKGVRDALGERAYFEELGNLPAYRELKELKEKVQAWKEGRSI